MESPSVVGKMQGVRKLYVSNAGECLAIYYFYGDGRTWPLPGWHAGGEGSSFMSSTTSEGVTTMRKSKEVAVSEADFSAAVKVFDQCAKTFWIYDAAARAGKRVDLKMGALCSDWNTLMSSKGNYIIEYATRQDFAKRPGRRWSRSGALPASFRRSRSRPAGSRFSTVRGVPGPRGAAGAAAYWARCRRNNVATGSRRQAEADPRRSSPSRRRKTPK
jgi:hypothetical protein